MDAVLWLDTQRQECRRRALGRRVDIVNDTEYHIDDNPPPTTNPPLCERLMPVIEPERAEEVIPDKHLAFDLQKDKLIKWFDKFGYEDAKDENTKIKLCHFIDGNSTNSDEITENITIVESIINRKQQEWVNKRENFRNEIIEEKERIRLEEEARLKAEEELKRKEEEEAKRAAERAARGEGEGDEPPPQEEVKEETKAEETVQEEEKAPQEELLPSKDNIDDDFAPVLMKIWDNIEELYVKRMKKSLNQYRNQRDRIVTGIFKTNKYFVQYLNRPDFKQAKLDKFVFDFNKFSDEYPDLREDMQTKEELHQRTDTLSDQLWEISEQRKNEAIAERKKIMENGWIEFELEQVTSMSQNLMQTEIDKFRNSVYLIYDYYYAIEDRLINDPPESLHYDLMTYTDEGGAEELPPVFTKEGEGQEAKENYPRLNKLYEKALKSQVLPEFECTPPGGGAGGDKKAPPKGKDPKKGPADEEKQEKFFYDQELKDAIATEKAVLRFRLTMVRNWALNLMKEIRAKSTKSFDKLATWIDVAFKAETDAILELEKVIKCSIEKEEKLQFELRIKGMDFHFDEKFLNFQDPPPEILPAREEPSDNRFTIKQLESLINELIISSENGFIKNEYFIDLMMSKTKNAKNFNDNNGVPTILKS
jgi:hypothetical protein